MFCYSIIDSWTTRINDRDCRFRIIQYENKTDFAMEWELSDDEIHSYTVKYQPTREEVEHKFTQQSWTKPV